jgi:hypothetical protein
VQEWNDGCKNKHDGMVKNKKKSSTTGNLDRVTFQFFSVAKSIATIYTIFFHMGSVNTMHLTYYYVILRVHIVCAVII